MPGEEVVPIYDCAADGCPRTLAGGMVQCSCQRDCGQPGCRGWKESDFAPPGTSRRARPSHHIVVSPTVRSADPLVRELADGMDRIAANYARETSGPGSRFEGRLLEDVQAEWVMRELARSGHGEPVPSGMVIPGPVSLVCQDHRLILDITGRISLRTLIFEARRHWRESHGTPDH